jgi:predicted small lipoprotein YifL
MITAISTAELGICPHVSTRRIEPALLSRRALIAGGLAALSLALAGCGRRGPLEPPPGSPDAKRLEERRAAAESTGNPLQRSGSRRPPPISRPNDPFILDPLLD